MDSEKYAIELVTVKRYEKDLVFFVAETFTSNIIPKS